MTDELKTTEEQIAAVLSGRMHYDEAEREVQASIRAEWDVRMAATREGLSFADDYEPGELVPEADPDGRLVWMDPRTGRRLPPGVGGTS